MHGYCSGHSGDVHAMASRIERCVSDISDWCAAKRLQLNADKTEVLWFGSPSQLRQLSSVSSAITANRNIIKPSSVVGDLDVLFDAELSMRQHVCHRRASFICAAYAQSVVNSAATSLPSNYSFDAVAH